MTKASDSKRIRQLAELLDETNLSEIEIESDGVRIRVARQLSGTAGVASIVAPTPAPAAAAQAAVPDEPTDLAAHPGAVTSPMVGTAYLAPEPGAQPFCKAGDSVSEGQTLFIVEAMKTMNPITAPKSGTLKQICVGNAQPVEFGEVLAVIE
ncbi:MAG: acetyl-CoA carboxylase biotin carboxyl carrier protein [Parvibaculales bacterium]